MRAMPRDPIPNQEPLLSYQIPFKDMSKWKDHYWRVELESAPRPFDPADKEGENGGDNMTSDTAGTKQPREFAFVLFEFLSLRRGESITGRATRIWKAWDEDQMERRQEDREVMSFFTDRSGLEFTDATFRFTSLRIPGETIVASLRENFMHKLHPKQTCPSTELPKCSVTELFVSINLMTRRHRSEVTSLQPLDPFR